MSSGKRNPLKKTIMDLAQTESRSWSRRRFLQTTSLGSLMAPAIVTAQKSDSALIVGAGDYRYEVLHDWARLPKRFSWQTSHNVAIDREGLLYVIHEGHKAKTDHPSIFVFDASGKYVRSFGSQFQGGGHGLEVHREGGAEFLYVTGYQHLKNFAKLTLTGEIIWEQHAPMASGIYATGENTHPQQVWGRDRFMPTNFAFHPDGGFYLADGYGAWAIHRYDKQGQWLSKFGGPGKADGQFQLPHGLWLDDRPGRDTSLVVADRVNGRLQWFTLSGEHLETLDGFILPANVDTFKDIMLVPDLSARITLLDINNKVIAHLGEDPDWRKEVLDENMKMRREPTRWRAGRFLHPHDACFDAQGNIFVAEWVATGRITKLRRLT